jgi:hypothetical protein
MQTCQFKVFFGSKVIIKVLDMIQSSLFYNFFATLTLYVNLNIAEKSAK